MYCLVISVDICTPVYLSILANTIGISLSFKVRKVSTVEKCSSVTVSKRPNQTTVPVATL